MSLRTENLAVVLTDIAGYTEATEHKSRREHEELLTNYSAILLPIIKRFDGRLIKTIGDALLLVFKSPTDAMICAMAMQDALFDFNRGMPKEKQIHIRIAASLGEVRVARKDIFGDAVNVTSRIESITPVDEIYFSEAVYLAMNKAEVPAIEIGWKKLKGISSEIRVYYIPRFSTAVLVPENVMGSEDIRGLTYPYGGAHLLGSGPSSSAIGQAITSLDRALSDLLSHKYSKVGLFSAVVVLIVALVVPLLWPDRERPSQTPRVSQEQTVVKTGVPPASTVVDSTASSPSQPAVPYGAVVSNPTQISSTAETQQTATRAPAAGVTGHAGQTAQPGTSSLTSAVGALKPADQQVTAVSVPPGPNASSPSSGAQRAVTGLPSGSGPSQSITPADPAPASSPSLVAPSPTLAPAPPSHKTVAPSDRAQTASVSPQKPKPKAETQRASKSLQEGMSAPVAKAPPPPRPPAITSFTEAKLAYAGHKITAEEYRMVVKKLQTAYGRDVEQLKLDYRSGKIDKIEYSRRAAEIKTRYK